jgi:hypothetical protein
MTTSKTWKPLQVWLSNRFLRIVRAIAALQWEPCWGAYQAIVRVGLDEIDRCSFPGRLQGSQRRTGVDGEIGRLTHHTTPRPEANCIRIDRGGLDLGQLGVAPAEINEADLIDAARTSSGGCQMDKTWELPDPRSGPQVLAGTRRMRLKAAR